MPGGVLYADDLAVPITYPPVKSTDEMEWTTSYPLAIQEELRDKGLLIDPSKTEVYLRGESGFEKVGMKWLGVTIGNTKMFYSSRWKTGGLYGLLEDQFWDLVWRRMTCPRGMTLEEYESEQS